MDHEVKKLLRKRAKELVAQVVDGAGVTSGGSALSGGAANMYGGAIALPPGCKQVIGTKRQVFNGSALKTAYGAKGLTKKDLMKNERGLIVSKRQHEAGKRAFERNGLKPKSAEEMKELRAMRKTKK